jgi:glucose/arabinose dehydrogenase
MARRRPRSRPGIAHRAPPRTQRSAVFIAHALLPGLILLQACQDPTAMAPDRDPDLADLHLAPGFAVEIFARVPGARSLAVTDDGAKVYVGSHDETIHAVLDPDRDGIADQVIEVASGLQAPNGVALAKDGSLFVAEQHRIVRIAADGTIEEIVPPGVLPRHRHHGWRYAAFGPDGALYVAVGAPCNVCEGRQLEGTIIRLRPDGYELKAFARGVRNSLGLDWHPTTGELFFTDNGADGFGDLIPPDELNRAPMSGLHFGFPYLYGPGSPYPDFDDHDPPQPVTHPALAFEPHAAALGIDFYEGDMFPEAYRNDAFVAQHGSWNRTDPIGYRIMRVRFDEAGLPVGKEVFVDGWLGEDGRVSGRPVDLEELPDGSLLVSDDHAGVIYRITYAE